MRKSASKRKSIVKSAPKRKSNVKSKDRINYKSLTKKQKDCVKNKIAFVMREFKNKKLNSKARYKIKNPKQAIAIALSIAKKDCVN
jgi:hypothetical protein